MTGSLDRDWIRVRLILSLILQTRRSNLRSKTRIKIPGKEVLANGTVLCGALCVCCMCMVYVHVSLCTCVCCFTTCMLYAACVPAGIQQINSKSRKSAGCKMSSVRAELHHSAQSTRSRNRQETLHLNPEHPAGVLWGEREKNTQPWDATVTAVCSAPS